VLAALLSLLLQAFAVQTHVHGFGTLAAVAGSEDASGSAASSDERVTAADEQTICVLCQALAANGNATLAGAAHAAALSNAAYQTAALEIRRAPRALTHSWQSRAPPIAA
jgi:hypothetical protein